MKLKITGFFPAIAYDEAVFTSCKGGEGAANEVGVWSIYLKVLIACWVWGTGTAVGELPPYFVARAAALAGKRAAELDEELGDGGGGGIVANLKGRVFGMVQVGEACCILLSGLLLSGLAWCR